MNSLDMPSQKTQLAQRTITIATRESALAMWQANHVAQALRALYPDFCVELLPMTTRGDQILDRPLSQVGGKGLFLKELEIAMQQGRAQLAVHSLKDVPMTLAPEFVLAAVMQREEPFDAWVSPHFASIAALPLGARVGTSSLRRQVQLRALRPDLTLLDLRGNVQTRLRKLDAGEFDGIVLAAAGLSRLGLASRIAHVLASELLPAAGQGALGIECLSGDADTAALVAPLAHAPSWLCTRAERAFAQTLGGSCQVPIGAYAQLHGSTLQLRGLVGDTFARSSIAGELSGPASAPEALGDTLARQLIARGAKAFLSV
jgi:hydroxymethylbilane synthase